MATSIACLLFAFAIAPPARAYFEDVTVDARSESMGGAAIADPRGLASYHWNPAGLAHLEGRHLMIDYGKPYAVPGLDTGALAVGARFRGIGFAASWHRLRVEDVYAEDVFGLAAGRAIPSPFPGHALEIGGNAKLGRIAFQPFEDRGTGELYDYGSQAKFSFDLGARWTTPWKLDAAWVYRDVARPRYRFVPGMSGDLVPSRHEVGIAYRWNRESTLTGAWGQIDEYGASHFNLGLEMWFFNVFAIRSGLLNTRSIYRSTGSPDDFQFTGGFGIVHRGWMIDASAVTSPNLGARYRVTLGLASRGSQ